MKSLLLSLIFLLSSCATTNFIRFEEGGIVSSKNNVMQIKEPSKFKISIDKTVEGKSKFLAVKIIRNEPIKEEWEDIYSKVAVNGTRCRGWRDPKFANGTENEKTQYCDIDSDHFIASHCFLVGFFYDLTIPFLPYDERVIESKESAVGTISKTNYRIIDSESPINTTSVKLTIDGVSTNSMTSQGVGKFNFSKLKLDPDHLPTSAQVVIEFDDQKLDLASEYYKLAETERSRQIAQEAYENRPEKEQCKPYDLFAQDCISHINSGGFRFIQILNDGILAQWPGSESILFIKMNGDLIRTTQTYSGDTIILNDLYIEHEGRTGYRNLRGQKMTAEVFKSYEKENFNKLTSQPVNRKKKIKRNILGKR